MAPRVERGAGALPLLSAARKRPNGQLAWRLRQTTGRARRCRCARRSARRDSAAGSVGKATRRAPPKPPARLGWARTAQRGPGGRYARSGKHRRNVPGIAARGRGSARAHYHTGARARRAPTRRPSAQPADGARLPRRGTAGGGCGLAPGDGARYGWRAPSRRRGGGLERGRRLRRPARHRSEATEGSGAGAAPSRAGGKGRPARAAGCGRLPLGSRGHPCNFPGVEL